MIHIDIVPNKTCRRLWLGEIAAVLKEAAFKGYRFDGALEWIAKTLEIVRELA